MLYIFIDWNEIQWVTFSFGIALGYALRYFYRRRRAELVIFTTLLGGFITIMISEQFFKHGLFEPLLIGVGAGLLLNFVIYGIGSALGGSKGEWLMDKSVL